MEEEKNSLVGKREDRFRCTKRNATMLVGFTVISVGIIVLAVINSQPCDAIDAFTNSSLRINNC